MQSLKDVQVGWDAIDLDGDKIGTVDQVGTQYFIVRKGLIFLKDLYVPLSAIDAVDAASGYVRLNVDKDNIDSMGWDAPTDDVDVSTRGDAGYVSSETAYGRETVDYDERRTSAVGDDDTYRVPVHEEELRAEKVREHAGEVEVRKDVVAEERTLDVPVTREEVDVRRYAVDRPASDADIVDTGDTIRVPVMGERVDVEKDVRVAEEVEISKRPVTETQRVSDTVRREEVDVEREGDVDVVADSAIGGADVGTGRSRKRPSNNG
jgi:uncharacterized protein (TIGR02271 family)